MTHVAWRQSGLPPTHVIGAGCNLDSERLSYVLKINLNTHKPAWVIGELSDNKSEPESLASDVRLISVPLLVFVELFKALMLLLDLEPYFHVLSMIFFFWLCSSCDEQHRAERWRSDRAGNRVERH